MKAARYIIKGGQVLNFTLQPKGGAAMHFLPASKEDMKIYKRLKVKTIL